MGLESPVVATMNQTQKPLRRYPTMSSRIARMSLLALALALCGSLAVHAADGEKPKGERGGRGGGPVKMLLSKAEEYKLTDEQKTKLEALGKTLADKQAAGEKPDREAT